MRIGLVVIMLGLQLLAFQAKATHIRGGEIIYRRINQTTFTYEIILRGYANLDSPVIFGSNGTLVFGDGTQEILGNTGCDDPFVCTNLDGETRFYEATFIHTYPGPGVYILSFYELYRNEGVQNLTNSVNMPFYIESQLIVDPHAGINSSPEFVESLENPRLIYPGFYGRVNQAYLANLQAIDVDGDSLSYRVIPVKEARNATSNGFRYPHQTFPKGDVRNGWSSYGDPPIFKINPYNGMLVWDSPGYGGEGAQGWAEYTAAVRVEEWRKKEGSYQRIGYVDRDWQVNIFSGSFPGPVPVLEMSAGMKAQKLEVGQEYSWKVTATAPEANQALELKVFGSLLQQPGLSISATSVRGTGFAEIEITYTPEALANELIELGVQAGLVDNAVYQASEVIYINRNPAEQDVILSAANELLEGIRIAYSAGQRELQITGLRSSATVSILDLQGRLVSSQNIQPEGRYKIPYVSRGIYLVAVSSKQGRHVQRFIF